MTRPQTVYRAGGGSGATDKRLHMTPDCPTLRWANTVQKKPRNVFPDDMPLCEWCVGGRPSHNGGDRSHYEALLRAAEEADDA